MPDKQVAMKLKKVVRQHNCAGCGACVLFSNGSSRMLRSKKGPVPSFENAIFAEEAIEVCPGIGINYPRLYETHYGAIPENLLHGHLKNVRIAYAADPELRRKGASGGVITATLLYLLEEKKVDAVVCVKQGIPSPETASYIIARKSDEIIAAMQSVYIPVSLLDALQEFKEGENYAMVLLPEQSSALRKLQDMGHPAARQVKYVLGPYTGTALYPAAIDSFLRSKGVKKSDTLTSLKWREGEWPGYLEIKTESGRVLQSKKIYYNFLIPFYVTHTSLRSMDFVNEFSDLAVGDAWSPKYEKEGMGFSVVVSRTSEMEAILLDMTKKGWITGEVVPKDESISMHGHMLDFKKRGGYIRNRLRKFFGHPVPDYGYRPAHIAFSRKLTEIVISSIFLLAGNRFSRAVMTIIPEKIMGPVFDFLRLRWKSMSKPTKRKGLSTYEIIIK